MKKLIALLLTLVMLAMPMLSLAEQTAQHKVTVLSLNSVPEPLDILNHISLHISQNNCNPFCNNVALYYDGNELVNVIGAFDAETMTLYSGSNLLDPYVLSVDLPSLMAKAQELLQAFLDSGVLPDALAQLLKSALEDPSVLMEKVNAIAGELDMSMLQSVLEIAQGCLQISDSTDFAVKADEFFAGLPTEKLDDTLDLSAGDAYAMPNEMIVTVDADTMTAIADKMVDFLASSATLVELTGMNPDDVKAQIADIDKSSIETLTVSIHISNEGVFCFETTLKGYTLKGFGAGSNVLIAVYQDETAVMGIYETFEMGETLSVKNSSWVALSESSEVLVKNNAAIAFVESGLRLTENVLYNINIEDSDPVSFGADVDIALTGDSSDLLANGQINVMFNEQEIGTVMIETEMSDEPCAFDLEGKTVVNPLTLSGDEMNELSTNLMMTVFSNLMGMAENLPAELTALLDMGE